MSDFRWDPLKNTWTITANSRERHPREFYVERQQVSMTTCPFCPGTEERTPPEVFAVRPPGSPSNGGDWRVRVVPNKFPLLRIEGQLDRRSQGLHQTMQGIGAHEVIIETPEHDISLTDLELDQLVYVFQAYRERLLDLRRDKRFRYLQIFKNHGIEAGSPVPHSHSQLIALPITPPVLKTELHVCRSYFREKTRCLICDLIDQELSEGQRVVYNDGHFLVVTPYASSSPFEMRLFPLVHSHDFALQDDTGLGNLAIALRNTLLKLRSLLHDPPYNFILHTAPPAHPRPGQPDFWSSLAQDYHWHLELVPRLNRIAGFEWGSGLHINPMPPETAARHLRNTEPSFQP